MAAPATSTEIKPLWINAYSAPGLKEVTAEAYGGKAAGLVRLYLLSLDGVGINIPTTFCIPVAHTFDRKPINLRQIAEAYGYNTVGQFEEYQDDIRFAVRSGAPVSMPGLMTTKLNVKLSEVQAAAEEVWNSWDTEHARAYREENGIPHDMGTGIVIQQMVTRTDYYTEMFSGVAFTCDPNTPLSSSFNPMVEAVDGLGDSLVGGTNSGFPVTSTSHIFSENLFRNLKLIHQKFGPSDVEWVARCCSYNKNTPAYWEITFVQHRPMKFVKIDLTEIESGAVITKGMSVGSKAKVCAPVTSDIADAKGKILMLNDFVPENYPAMLKCAGMIVDHGGSTCHAAIVARDMGKVCISGVYSPALVSLPAVVLDGFTGDISFSKDYEAIDTDDDHEIVKLIPERVPDFRVSSRSYYAEALLARFYVTVGKHHDGEISTEQRDEIVRELAKILGAYLYQSTICEARHVWRTAKTKPGTRNKTAFMHALRKLGIKISRFGRSDRDSFVKTVPAPSDVRKAAKITRMVVRCFNDLLWPSSYGGPKWGKIASLLYDYLTGKLSDLFFVDSVFNLQHNGGSVFGKFGWMGLLSGDLMKKLLDLKRDGHIDQLVPIAKKYAGLGGGKNVEDTVTAKSLLWFMKANPQVNIDRSAEHKLLDGESILEYALRMGITNYSYLNGLQQFELPKNCEVIGCRVPEQGDSFIQEGCVVYCGNPDYVSGLRVIVRDPVREAYNAKIIKLIEAATPEQRKAMAYSLNSLINGVYRIPEGYEPTHLDVLKVGAIVYDGYTQAVEITPNHLKYNTYTYLHLRKVTEG